MKTRSLTARTIAMMVLAALLVVCDAADPSANAPDIDELRDRISFLTEDIPVDGAMVFPSMDRREEMPAGRDHRFATFITETPPDPDRALVLTRDLGLAKYIGLTGGHHWSGDMLYRADGVWTEASVAGAALPGMGAYGSSTCHLSDYQNQPSSWDFITGSERAQEFIAYGQCVDDLLGSIQGAAGCVVVSVPVWNSDTEVYDLHSYVVCNEHLF